MDIETSEAIESVRSEIARVEGSLRGDIGRVETSLRADIEKLGHTVREEMGVMRDELRGEMYQMRDELKRHTDIRIEDVRDDIRILAEGFASLSGRIDRLAR